jgi:hypothetical protein
MKFFLTELKLRSELLFWFGAANLLLTLLFLVLTRVTTLQIVGVNAWNKPFKFAMSIAIYAWTMAWFIAYLPHLNKGLFSWTVTVLLGLEIFYIALQAARGQLSHYNISTPLYTFLYNAMAVAATGVALYTAYIGFLFFTQKFPGLPTYYLWSIRLGIVLFVLFSFEGFIMGATLSHTVGGSDGSIGLPLVGWSLSYGDLRVAHFVGMHALQVLPLLSYYLLRNSALTIAGALLYAALAVFVLVVALQGRPLIKSPMDASPSIAGS